MPGAQTLPPPAGQQSTTPPQPSAMNPQFFAPHVAFVQGGAPQSPGFIGSPPHVWPIGHVVGQLMMPPHPSDCGPQSPGPHVVFVGTQPPPSPLDDDELEPPHLLGPPPPHVPDSHVPQLIRFPQPSF
jgi:hypothetical protein